MNWLRRMLLWLMPREFRDRHGRDLLELHQDLQHATGRYARIGARIRVAADLILTGLSMRLSRLWRQVRGGRTHIVSGATDAAAITTPRRWMIGTQSLLHDVRYGLRTLRKRPLFATVAITTLGIGIGATTAMFSVVDGVLLRPLPYERPGELVHIWQTYPNWRSHEQLAALWDRNTLSYPDYRRLREHQTMYVDVGIYGYTQMTFTGLGDPERVFAGVASASLFHVLGIRPALGRLFRPEEEGRNAARVTVLANRFWVERFGSEPGVLGKSILLDGVPFTVVGVLPSTFQLRTLEVQGEAGERPFWIPVGANGATLGPEDHSFEAVARLRQGLTPRQATGETDVLIRGDRDLSAKGAWVVPRTEAESAGIETPLIMLLAASFVLLLIACGNVSLLLLGEVSSRRQEIATRVALGAGRRRIIRQLLTESVLLGMFAAVLGAFLAVAGTRLVMTMAPPLPRLDEVGVNGIVLTFTAIIGVTTGALFGMFPALYLSQAMVRGAMGRGKQGGDRRESFSQQVVVASEIALTVVLLVSGGLLVRSLANLLTTDPGFRQGYLAEVRVELPTHGGSPYRNRQLRLRALQDVRVALEAVPGVTAVSGASSIPFSDIPSFYILQVEGWDSEVEGYSPHAFLTSVLPDYFETMGIPLLAGRTFSNEERDDSPGIAVISKSMARRFWRTESALGARIVRGPDTVSVVGIVGDVRYESMNAEIRPAIYVSAMHRPSGQMSFVVNTPLKPESIFPLLREAVWSVAPDAPITRTATVASLISQSTSNEKFRAVVLAIFGICAAVLAASGVFGITARGVTRRHREFGIRVALGARQRRLVRSVLRTVLTTGIAGVVSGLILAYWASRLLARFLFGVEPADPFTYGAVAALSILVCLSAGYLPARRIASVDPAQVLRSE